MLEVLSVVLERSGVVVVERLTEVRKEVREGVLQQWKWAGACADVLME
jgi:hypothetical protein